MSGAGTVIGLDAAATCEAAVRGLDRFWTLVVHAGAVESLEVTVEQSAGSRRHRIVALIGVGVLAVSACNNAAEPDAAAAAAPVVASSTTTAAPTTTTVSTTKAPSTTTTTMSAWDALPSYIRGRDWHHGTYESVGYSCEGTGNPDVECDAPHRVQFTRAWIGSDLPEIPVDFIDFFGSYDPEAEPFPPDSPYSYGMLLGGVDATPEGLGHGIRVQQLDRAPPGLDIGGEAWIRLTISSLSASDRAEATGKLVPSDFGYRIETGSEGDPLNTPYAWRGEPTQWIESVVLVATNDTMSEWIVAFNQPGTYTSTAMYWHGTGFAYGLNINFLRL